MAPKTKMTPEQVAQDIEKREANVREYVSPRSVRNKGVNQSIELKTPTPKFEQPWDGKDHEVIEGRFPE